MSTPVPQDGIWILVPQDENPMLLFPPAGNIGVTGGGGGGSGDVVGPASATDDRIAAFDGVTGKLIKQGTVTATAVASHIGSTSNPHSVTAAQVGADPTGTATGAVSTHNSVTTAHGISAFGATLVDDATAGDARTTLGLGTAATTAATDYATAAQGTDARAPTAHKTSHATGGTDALTAADIGAAAASHSHAASDITSGTLDAARLPAPTTTTLGGVKRNTGSAGQYVTGIDTDGSLLRDTPAGGGGSSNTKWVGAGELIPRVTNGAGIDGEELATNDINFDYLAFDTGTSEGAQVAFAWPGAYTTFTATFHWTAASGSGGVRWQASATCYADDAALDAAQGTVQAVTDTLLLANDLHKSSATSAITPAGTVASGNLCVVEIERDPAHADDTLAVDARLIGVLLEFA